MPTTVGGKEIVTKDSGHQAITPPATSLMPPPPPAGPVPTPMPYMVQSSSGKDLKSNLTINSSPVACKDCGFDVAPPANTTSQATGADVVSHAEVKAAAADEGDDRVTVDGKALCGTGHMVRANMMAAASTVSQVKGPWVKGAGVGMEGSGPGTGSGASPGSADAPADALQLSDPVTAATGLVVDRAVDFTLPGLIPITFERRYSSARRTARGALGVGGWTHPFEQSLSVDPARPEVIVLRDGDGREIAFAAIEVGAETFHRRERLALKRTHKDAYQVYSVDDRRTRKFASLREGGEHVLLEIRDVFGNAIKLEHVQGRLARVVDTAKRQLRFQYDAGKLAKVEIVARGEVQQVVEYGYSLGEQLASATDAEGYVERYRYDDKGRLVEKTFATGLSFRYVYDDENSNGRCVAAYGDGGLQAVRLSYDDAQKLTRVSGNEEPRTFTWDADGFVVREESGDGTYVIVREYDDDKYLLSEANGAGEARTFAWDERGRCVKEVDPAGNETTYEWSDDVLVKRVDPDGGVTEFGYDGYGSLESIAFPDGRRRFLYSDGQGRLLRVEEGGRTVASYAYDDEHNRIEIVDKHGAVRVRSFDALGRIVESAVRPGKHAEERVRQVRVSYDRIGRLVAMEREDGAKLTRTYDARGMVTSHTDPRGTWRMQYAGTGRLVRLVEPNGQTWRCEYDRLERLRRAVDPRGQTYEYEYDRAGRIVEEKTFDERRIRYSYSKAGRVARVQHSDESWRELSYDVLGNVVEERTEDGVASFERNARGFVMRAVLDEDVGTTIVEFERDAHDRVLREIQGDHVIEYALDAYGSRVARSLLGERTEYVNETDGEPIAIRHQGREFAIGRDPLGRIQAIRAFGTVQMEWRWDGETNLLGERVVAASAEGPRVLVERSREYDLSGRPTKIEDVARGTTRLVHDESTGHLQSIVAPDFASFFEWDVTGSLVKRVDPHRADGDDDAQWSVGTGNVLRARGRVRYAYDQRHRRIRAVETAKDGSTLTTSYRWDSRDRLREVRLPDGTRVHHVFDAYGRRVRKHVIPPPETPVEGAAWPKPFSEWAEEVKTIDFVWDGSVLAGEVEQHRGKRSTRVFVHLPGSPHPLAQSQGGEVFLVVTDALGKPHELIDEQGLIAWRGVVSGFGELIESQPAPNRIGQAIAPPFRLLGAYADEETGLAYTKYRFFDPSTARWLSADPMSRVGGENLFGFNGSPYVETDPLGLACNLPSYPTIATPWGVASQDPSPAALAARNQVANGATLYRIGTTGKSEGPNAQFWALEHPLSPGYAARYGIPPENVTRSNFIETAVLAPGAPFVTRPAPPVGPNPGGGIEVVVPTNGTVMTSFSSL